MDVMELFKDNLARSIDTDEIKLEAMKKVKNEKDNV